jgi:hypothetical protein
MKSLIPAVILLSCSISGLAQAPSPSTPAQDITLTGQTRREVIEAALSALDKNYVFPETAKKMETAIRQRMDRGEYDRITDPQQFAHWRPENSTQEIWTSESVAGKRYGAKPIWILTSQQTISAAELFAYDLKTLKRAVTVGETTGGGAHTTRLQRLHDHFGMLTPAGRTINAITKTDWEGAGVPPDLAAPASDALRVAHAAAVRSAIERGVDQARKQELQDLLMELEVPAKPTPVDAGGLRLPKTLAGDAMRSFLLALNSGDIGRLRHFHRTRGANVSFGRRDYERLFQPSGGLKTRRIVKSSDFLIEVLAQFKKDNTWQRLSVEVEAIAPHRVKKIDIDNAEPPAK